MALTPYTLKKWIFGDEPELSEEKYAALILTDMVTDETVHFNGQAVRFAAEGKLTTQELHAVRRHLSRCSFCRTSVRDYRRIIQNAPSDF